MEFEEIWALIDKQLPAEEVGTERESVRATIYNELKTMYEQTPDQYLDSIYSTYFLLALPEPYDLSMPLDEVILHVIVNSTTVEAMAKFYHFAIHHPEIARIINAVTKVGKK